MTPQGPRLPGLDHRLLVVGTTGSGKSVAAAWHLLQYRVAFPDVPWVIFNPKHDKLLDSIGARPIQLTDGLPKKRLGNDMMIVHPVAEAQEDDADVNKIIDQAMWHGRVGLYFDEGYSIPSNSKPFRRALTQGRSKQVPVIILSQRPVFLDKFAFTEASFIRAFFLLDANDRKKVRENTGIKITDDMPPYFSHYYDVSNRRATSFGPGPDEREIVERFRSMQLEKKTFLQSILG